MNPYYQKYLDYVTNTGGSPTVDQFDEDWEPVGEMVRNDLVAQMLITISDNIIELRDQT